MKIVLSRTLWRLVPVGLLALNGPWAWAAQPAWVREAEPVFRHIKLPDDIVPVAALQDREGLMWFAAQIGVVFWDGYRFHHYGHMADGTMFSDRVDAVLEDREGHLWLGSATSGLLRVEKTTGQLLEGPAALRGSRILALASEREGNLWIGGAAGLDRFEPHTGKLQRERDGALPQGLPGRNVTALLIDRRDTLWVGTEAGLYRLPAGAPMFRSVPLVGESDKPVEVMKLAEDDTGRVWVGTRLTGAFVVDSGAVSVRHIVDGERSGDGKDIETDTVSAIADAGNGHVWLGVGNHGIVQVDTATWTTRWTRHDADRHASLASGGIRLMLRDRSGQMWVAGAGLLDSHDPLQQWVSSWHGGSDGLVGGSPGSIDTVLSHPDGSVWLGSAKGGIDIVPPDGRPRIRVAPDPRHPHSALPRAPVLSLAATADGKGAYAGTGRGLYLVHDGGRRVERLEYPGLDPTAYVADLSVCDGRLWILSGEGVLALDLRATQAVPENVAALGGQTIWSLTCARDGSVWVSTETGLVRYWPASQRVERPWPEQPGRVGLPTRPAASVAEDSKGRLWFAFYGGGVRVVDKPTEGSSARVRRIGHEEGLPNNAAAALLLDAEGNGWVSTDNGLLRIDGTTLTPTLLQQSDGVGLLAYWSGAADAQGSDLLFGALGGLTVVHPQAFLPRRFKAPIRLATDEGLPVSNAGITLAPSKRSLQVTFSLLDFAAPERTRYAYRLLGLEKGWTVSSADSRMARYTNLSPGDYTLEIRAASQSGDWTTERWPLRVEPAWYETTLFHIASGLGAIGLLVALVRFRTRLLVRRAAELRELVARRTQELEQRTDQLATSRAALQELGAHNVRALEDERKRVARELHDELGQQLAALGMEVSVLRVRSASGTVPAPGQWEELRGRVDRLVVSMRRLVADLRPPALDAGLPAALEWLAAEFTRSTEVPCHVDVDPSARSLAPDMAVIVFRIAQESLNNVRRHAHATHAEVGLRQVGQRWVLAIIDDGTGFDASSPRKGYGLLGMHERAHLVGGSLKVFSQPGAGTRVTLTI